MVLETDTDNLDTLRQMEGIVNVWQAHKVPMPEVHRSANGPSSAARNYSIHHWTGVDKLHAAGIRGKGSTVAIIDTGIDYKHKAVCLSYFTLTRGLIISSLGVALALDVKSREAMTLLEQSVGWTRSFF
jgi:hypothetical protein